MKHIYGLLLAMLLLGCATPSSERTAKYVTPEPIAFAITSTPSVTSQPSTTATRTRAPSVTPTRTRTPMPVNTTAQATIQRLSQSQVVVDQNKKVGTIVDYSIPLRWADVVVTGAGTVHALFPLDRDISNVAIGMRAEVTRDTDTITGVSEYYVTQLKPPLFGVGTNTPARTSVLAQPKWVYLSQSGTQLQASWTQVPGATKYTVFYNPNGTPHMNGALPVPGATNIASTAWNGLFNSSPTSQINLINPSFESNNLTGWGGPEPLPYGPDSLSWLILPATISSTHAYSRTYSALIQSNVYKNGANYYYSTLNSDLIPVIAGNPYTVSLYAFTDNAVHGSNSFSLYIAWYDATKTIVPYGSGGYIGAVSGPFALNSWTLRAATKTAPATAAYMELYFAPANFGDGVTMNTWIDLVSVSGQAPVSVNSYPIAVVAYDDNGNASPPSEWLIPVPQAASVGSPSTGIALDPVTATVQIINNTPTRSASAAPTTQQIQDDFSLLTAPRHRYEPDKDGTYAMTSDITGGGGLYVGAVIANPTSSLPTGFLWCDGSAVSRTTYAALFTYLGTTFGSGDGSTTFNLPDLNGRTIYGKGSNADVSTVGNSDGLANASRTPKHTHNIPATSIDWGTGAGSPNRLSVYGSSTEQPTSDKPTGSGNEPYLVVGGWVICYAPPSVAVAVAGNPSAQTGLAAINGTAITWMRSDASPALDPQVIHAATAKTSLVDGDELPIADSAASNVWKKITSLNAWVNYFKSKADALYAVIGHTHSYLSTALTSAHIFVGNSSNVAIDTALSGDATIDNTGVLTIANAVVTLTKMANMATASLIYRKTAGSGAPEVNSLATLKSDLGSMPATAHNILSATHGDATAASAVRGDVITAQGASPTWSRLAISVPAANVLNVLGAANGDTEPSYKTILDGTTPATETVGGAGAAGTSLVAAHRDHAHPITNPALDTLASPTDITTLNTSTTAHGLAPKMVAPASGLLNVLGIANTETAASNKALFDTTNPAALGSVGPGTQIIAARRDHIHSAASVPLTTPTIDGKKVTFGTSNPGSPSSGDANFRTDLGLWTYYDGTRWLTAHEVAVDIPQTYYTVSGTRGLLHRLRTDYAPYITRVAISTNADTTNNASNYWTIAIRGINLTDSAATTIDTFNTSADTVNTWTNHERAPGSTATPANYYMLDVLATKSGSPGGVTVLVTAYYRLIVT